MTAPVSGNTREQENRDRRGKPKQACDFLLKTDGPYLDADQTPNAATFSPGTRAASAFSQRQNARKGGRCTPGRVTR